MMAWRIAYCKVYYPLAYYAAYFSIRATAFNYELMCQGKDKLNYFIRITRNERIPYKKGAGYGIRICVLCRKCMQEVLLSDR